MNSLYNNKNKVLKVHLISDATGETIQLALSACMAQFPSIKPDIEIWNFVNNSSKIVDVIKKIKLRPGFIMFSIVNEDNKKKLESLCKIEKFTYVSVLDPILEKLKSIFSISQTGSAGSQYRLDKNYYSRIEALDYTMQHDDGNNLETLEIADIVLVGLSRTSKTPTSIFLANKGYKVGNIPIVLNKDIPNQLKNLNSPKVVGLIYDPRYLSRIRQSRLETIGDFSGNNYSDIDNIRKEVLHARQLFSINNWVTIDVTRRSVEETSASILQLIEKND